MCFVTTEADKEQIRRLSSAMYFIFKIVLFVLPTIVKSKTTNGTWQAMVRETWDGKFQTYLALDGEEFNLADAKSICSEKGGSLPSISDDEDIDYFSDRIIYVGSSTWYFWLNDVRGLTAEHCKDPAILRIINKEENDVDLIKRTCACLSKQCCKMTFGVPSSVILDQDCQTKIGVVCLLPEREYYVDQTKEDGQTEKAKLKFFLKIPVLIVLYGGLFVWIRRRRQRREALTTSANSAISGHGPVCNITSIPNSFPKQQPVYSGVDITNI